MCFFALGRARRVGEGGEWGGGKGERGEGREDSDDGALEGS